MEGNVYTGIPFHFIPACDLSPLLGSGIVGREMCRPIGQGFHFVAQEVGRAMGEQRLDVLAMLDWRVPPRQGSFLYFV